MPCYDGGYGDDNPRNQEKVDKLTRLLCEAMTMLDKSKWSYSKELQDWWTEHQKVDLKRQRLAVSNAEQRRRDSLRRNRATKAK